MPKEASFVWDGNQGYRAIPRALMLCASQFFLASINAFRAIPLRESPFGPPGGATCRAAYGCSRVASSSCMFTGANRFFR